MVHSTPMKTKTITIITHSAEQTGQLGIELARGLCPGDLVALSGNLGAGKTCLIQGICTGLGVDDYVNSPTFTLINIYQGRIPIFHFDLYRLADASELDELGYEEYFWGNGLTLVEWADKANDYYPDKRFEIDISYLGVTHRRITISAFKTDISSELENLLNKIYENFSV